MKRAYARPDLPVNSRTAAVGILLQRRLVVELEVLEYGDDGLLP